MNDFFLAFVPVFVAVDALGMVPFFLSITRGMNPKARSELVRRSVFTALLVATSFLFAGRLVFSWLGITMNDFMVAGGVILFVIAIRDLLLFGKGSNVPEDEAPGVVPLAVPLIVGPGVLTTSLILLGSFGIWPTLFSIVANVLLAWLVLLASPQIAKVLGEAGSHTLSKVANLFLAAIGVMLMRRGIVEILSTVSH